MFLSLNDGGDSIRENCDSHFIGASVGRRIQTKNGNRNDRMVVAPDDSVSWKYAETRNRSIILEFTEKQCAMSSCRRIPGHMGKNAKSSSIISAMYLPDKAYFSS